MADDATNPFGDEPFGEGPFGPGTGTSGVPIAFYMVTVSQVVAAIATIISE